MHIVLFDTAARKNFFPFAHTRPLSRMRCGILNAHERWEKLTNATVGALCPDYMQAVFPAGNLTDETFFVDARVIADKHFAAAVSSLPQSACITYNSEIIAFRPDADASPTFENLQNENYSKTAYTESALTVLNNVWDIFSKNDVAIAADFATITAGRKSAPIPDGVTAIAPENIFIEADAVVRPSIINASTGPVYVGAEAEIMEGCMLRGPLALGAHAVLKMGAKVYGATTIGEGCKAGGELSNVVLFANSNKGHDGFLGNAVIGEWCNLGADTNCSNLKNNYDNVKIWSEAENKLVPTGLQFCGLLMGDHAKCGINTMFNTGTVVGVSANIFGAGFPEKFVPSFTWGGTGNSEVYAFDKAMETAARMMMRRGKHMSQAEQNMYRHLFDARSAK